LASTTPSFLLARVREEAERHGAVDSVARGLASTGGVITSAGVILAGTFAVLASFPLDAMLQLGLVVSLGVLLDTFVVRTLLLPGLVALLGDRAWWPKSPSRNLSHPPEAT
jgi:RND superfamily putative drug exporter